ncbi:hypothetical protein DPMN_020232 [Dreissena polymorpha]|uniref:Uncharacterized protein n=1 Tax=Dreissena polymorpha TaxID=45954 RepID=A0A9D4NM67_DREPO|nr:hypothetical protein DPMN_020232 [Dreissena polymorpha]
MSNYLTDDQKIMKKFKNVGGRVVPNIPIYSTFSSTSQLIDVAKQLKSSNVRVRYVRDNYPRHPNMPGTHWTAWIKNGNEKIYFDTCSLEPPLELVTYLNNQMKTKH